MRRYSCTVLTLSFLCKVHRALQWHGLHRPEELVIRVQPLIGKLILLEEEGFCVSVISHVIKCLTELRKPFFFHCLLSISFFWFSTRDERLPIMNWRLSITLIE